MSNDGLRPPATLEIAPGIAMNFATPILARLMRDAEPVNAALR
jgi:hypothetical protein